MLTDTDNVLSEVKILSVEAEQAEPQLAHHLSVLPVLWPATWLQVEEDKIDMLIKCGVTGKFTKACVRNEENTH